jgi:hypothetical protein
MVLNISSRVPRIRSRPLALVGVFGVMGASYTCMFAASGSADTLGQSGSGCNDGASKLPKTLCGFNGTNPAFDQAERMLRAVMAVTRARL